MKSDVFTLQIINFILNLCLFGAVLCIVSQSLETRINTELLNDFLFVFVYPCTMLFMLFFGSFGVKIGVVCGVFVSTRMIYVHSKGRPNLGHPLDKTKKPWGFPLGFPVPSVILERPALDSLELHPVGLNILKNEQNLLPAYLKVRRLKTDFFPKME